MDMLTLLAEIVKDTPDLVVAFRAALQKRGYTNEQIDAIFAGVVPPEQLGIDPKHPVAPETATAPVLAVLPDANPPVTGPAHSLARAQEIQAAANAPVLASQAQPFVHATHVPLETPVGATPAVTPPPVPLAPQPFERAR